MRNANSRLNLEVPNRFERTDSMDTQASSGRTATPRYAGRDSQRARRPFFESDSMVRPNPNSRTAQMPLSPRLDLARPANLSANPAAWLVDSRQSQASMSTPRAESRRIPNETADMATQTEAPATMPDPENLPLQGGAGLKEAIVGSTGILGGLKALAKGRMAEGFSNIIRSVLSAPVQLGAVILDGPRKVADVAAAKGKKLVQSGEAQGGIVGALKAFGGGLMQVLGGIARLTKPALGIALIALAGPPGWIAGGALLGLYVLKELFCIVNDKVDELQTLKVLRDIGSGIGAIVGSVLSPITQPIAKAINPPKAAKE